MGVGVGGGKFKRKRRGTLVIVAFVTVLASRFALPISLSLSLSLSRSQLRDLFLVDEDRRADREHGSPSFEAARLYPIPLGAADLSRVRFLGGSPMRRALAEVSLPFRFPRSIRILAIRDGH